jgi:predicted MPP superfamily phosphohydrolase
MAIFLSLYFFVYGGMNVYFFWKIRLAFRLGPLGSALLAVALIGLVLLPFLIRRFEHQHALALARYTGWIGFSWMTVALWFFSLGLIFDLGNGFGKLLDLTFGLPGFRLSPFTAVVLNLTLTAILLIAGLLENNRITLRPVTLPLAAEVPPHPPLRILLISDVHLGLLQTELYLRDIERAVAETRPDLILSAGDLFDGRGDQMPEVAARLARLEAPWGKFAVLGNHEFYAGLTESLRFHKAAGFTLLRGETRTLETNGWSLVLAGIDFPAEGVWGRHAEINDPITEPRRPGRYQILLKHLPVPSPKLGSHYDLQLSGHTHGGQIIPFNWVVKAVYPYLQGLFPMAGGRAQFYVSRGTGSWGPPIRLGPGREITLFTIE